MESRGERVVEFAPIWNALNRSEFNLKFNSIGFANHNLSLLKRCNLTCLSRVIPMF